MKSGVVLTTLFVIFIMGCSSRSRDAYVHKYSNLVALTRQNQVQLFAIVNDSIRQIGKLDFPPYSNVIIGNNGWIAAIPPAARFSDSAIKRWAHTFPREFLYMKENNMIMLGKIDRYYNITYFPTIKFPHDHLIETVKFYDDIMFIAGKGTAGLGVKGYGEKASLVNLDDPEKKIIPLDMPEALKKEGKSIDEILFRGNKMILVDDCIYPKYLFEYDITCLITPKLINQFSLYIHGSYEKIVKAQISEKYITLMSTIVGSGGSAKIVTVLDVNTYKEVNEFWSSMPAVVLPNEKTKELQIVDCCLVGNNVYFVADTNKVYFKNVYDKNAKIGDKYIDVNRLKNVKKIFSLNGHLLLVDGDNFELLKL